MKSFDFKTFAFKESKEINESNEPIEQSSSNKEATEESIEQSTEQINEKSNEENKPIKDELENSSLVASTSGRKEIFCDASLQSNKKERKPLPKPVYRKYANPQPFIGDGEDDEPRTTPKKSPSNRYRAARSKKKEFLTFSDDEEEDEEEDEDYSSSEDELRYKSKRKSKPQFNTERTKVTRKGTRFNDDHDISKDFKPLRKVNRSITIGYDDNASLFKPLRDINKKMSLLASNGHKNMSDEIMELIENDNDASSTDSKKRKNRFMSDDEDSNLTPAKKKSKKKKVVYTDDESNNDQLDDIQVILDEDGQSDDNYESDENILSSSSDDEEIDEEGSGEVKVKKAGKEKKLLLKESLVKLCNEGKESELMSIASINRKVYDELILLREFKDWHDLFTKFERSKNITTDVIERLSDYLKTKNVISNIMDQCQELSNKIKESVKNLKEHREPKCLNKKLKLKPYQLVGLNYLVLMFKQKMNCILADEMGLGKTIQVIALLAYLREECSIYGPHLIVVPSSILNNWEREFELWCPKIKIIKYYGNQDERAQLRYDIISKSVSYDVIVTTYNMLYSGDDKKLLTRVRFQYAVFDEAHMLKNMKSNRFKNLFSVKAKYRLMLTGTPIQNNLLELISLLTFTVPNLFYSKLNFMEEFFKNKKFDDNKSEFVQEKTDQAKEILRPFILRRIKENVLKELPGKKEQYVTLDMTDEQGMLYERIVTMYSEQVKARKERKEREKREKFEEKVEIIEDRNRRRKVLEYNEDKLFYVEELDQSQELDNSENLLNEDDTKLEKKMKEVVIEVSSESSSDIWSSEDGKTNDKSSKEKQGSILMELRKCANHPLLIRNLYTNDQLLKMAQTLKKKEPYYQKDGNISYMVEDMAVLNDFDLHMLCKKFPCINQFKLNDKKILESNKFHYLDKALADFKKKNQKVLIFSQFVMMLDIIEEYLKIKKIKYCRLDGSTKVTDRMSTIDNFKDKEILVFLLTTKAGGVGINLVEANNVIMHDSDFNPYNDIQAQARAHRIGQTQEVNIYKLISDKTVEVHMRNIAEEKLDVGKKITQDKIERAKREESSDVKLLLKKALNI